MIGVLFLSAIVPGVFAYRHLRRAYDFGQGPEFHHHHIRRSWLWISVGYIHIGAIALLLLRMMTRS